MKFWNKFYVTIFLFFPALFINATNYYVSNSLGNDLNSGLSIQSPIKTLQKLNTFTFSDGDSILFKSADTLEGMFWIKGSGNFNHPIVIDVYGGNDKAIINGNGYQSCILIMNDEFISINNLNLYNENSHLDSLGNVKLLSGFGGASNSWGSGKNIRFGIKVVASSKSLKGFSFKYLELHHIFPSPTATQNIHKGYGIKIETQSDTTSLLLNTISEISIENCDISFTGHYGIWIKSIGLNNIDSVKNSDVLIKNCNFLNTGGSGFVPNKSKNILVENCYFNHTGSSIDSRMWKRGSGMWTFDCKDVVIQNNYFKNAHGPQDSYGSHIDYGNENVVIQYNYSFNNEGGFAEILGDNINCGYRYNISVNDGYREDPNNASWDKKGKIFWISNFCGSGPRCPSTGTFIYNNTIFLNDTINPEIYFWPNIGDVHIYNNIIYAGSNGLKIPTLVQNTSNTLNISHNLFYDSSRFSFDTDLLNNAFFSNPNLVNPLSLGIDNPNMYQIQNNSSAIGSGFLISGSGNTTDYLNNNGGQDYFGNPVSSFENPNLGACNGSNLNIFEFSKKKNISVYPSVTEDNLTISIKNYIGEIETHIYSLNGTKLDLQKGKVISLTNCKKGIYILEVHYKKDIEKIKVIKL